MNWRGPHFATWHLEGLKPNFSAAVCDLGTFTTARISCHWQTLESSPTFNTVPEAKAWAEEAARRHGAIA